MLLCNQHTNNSYSWCYISTPNHTHTPSFPSSTFPRKRKAEEYLYCVNRKEAGIEVLCKVLSSQIKWSVLQPRVPFGKDMCTASKPEIHDRHFNYMLNFDVFHSFLQLPETNCYNTRPLTHQASNFFTGSFNTVSQLFTKNMQKGKRRRKELFFVRPIHSDLSPFVVLIMWQSRITEVLNSTIMPTQRRRRVREADHFGISKHDTIRRKKIINTVRD